MATGPSSGMPAQIADKLSALPPLGEGAGRLMREVLKEKCDAEAVVRTIESDEELVSRVLRMLNDPGFGLGWNISTVRHAVGLLGARAVESMAVSLTVFDILSGGGGANLSLYWRHSLATAAAARFIAQSTLYGIPEEAYTAGILHDLGRAVLMLFAPEEHALVEGQLGRLGGVGVEIERRTVGVDHADIGEFVLRRWKMPDRLSRAVGLHHAEGNDENADRQTTELARILQAADFAAWSAGLGGTSHAPKLALTAPVEALLAKFDEEVLFAQMMGELRRSGELFRVKVPDEREIRRSLSKTAAELARFRSMHRDVEDRLSRRTREVDAVSSFRKALRNGAGEENVPNALVAAIREALDVDRAVFLDVEPAKDEIVVSAVADVTASGAAVLGKTVPKPPADSVYGSAVAGNASVRLTGLSGEGPILKLLGANDAIAAPVRAKDRVVGLIVAANHVTGRWLSDADIEGLSGMALEAGVALENRQLQQYADKLKAQAETDPLTGINNRRNLLNLLQREIHRAERYGSPLSMVMIDLDHFKVFNDLYGHQAGDQLLESFAKLLAKSCRNIDFPGRLGGEEFVVILPDSDIEAAGIYAERLRRLCEKMGQRLRERYDGYTFTVSVGITSYNQKEDDIDSFMRRADNAMYSAKQRGRNRVCAL